MTPDQLKSLIEHDLAKGVAQFRSQEREATTDWNIRTARALEIIADELTLVRIMMERRRT